MKIRLVILPPQGINKVTAQWAKKIAGVGKHHFLVDNRKLLPHITLFTGEVSSKKDVTRIAEALQPIVKSFVAFDVELTEFRLEEGVWFGWYIKPNAVLTKLRENLYQAAKKIPGLVVTYKVPYKPHITFTKFVDIKNAQKSNVFLTKVPARLKVQTIALTKDKSTQVPEVYKKVFLRKSEIMK